ncbi:MAG: hypothetical protein WCY27_01140 [archaeon]|jgi:hypothetical protein|nr:hypothetical protein [archaeon]MDD2478007.1 hypothetical protein [Candidatus ainarchaeum sp.]MDD3084881.1 hypothetical protein [Candidatus ainarchaeum sp.]MDD4221161.1 hypothetical protein [Candidatus ainarchaeum sp.]MDD4662966.1 hypothetical protein [Candidatus ainarchaeum sp.]
MFSYKGQTSVEFLIILAVVFILSLAYISSLYITFDVNVGISKIKNRTLELISLSDNSFVIQKINYITEDKKITFDVYLQKINTTEELIDESNYTDVIDKINKVTKFDETIVNISYLN